MEISEIKNKKTWNSFYNTYGEQTFLQSWEWGILQENLGHDVLRLGIYSNKKLKAIALVLKVKAARGNFLFVPHGPLSSTSSIYLKEILKYLLKTAKEGNFRHLRVAPILVDNPKDKTIFAKAGFRKSPTHMHAENVWVLDISKPEEQLLADMRKTTRYLIRKAIKDEIVIERVTDLSALDKFWKVYQKTVERENFTPFSKDFIKKEFEAFNSDSNAIFLLGREKNSKQILAAALVIFNKQTGFYHQGASLHSKVPVAYLMQWEAILEAKKRGCKYYNFWGIAPNESEKHPWHGLSLFKKGFNGFQIDYLPTQDYVFSPVYYLTFAYERIVKWKRNL